MCRTTAALTLLALVASLNAYLQFPGAQQLIFRDNSLQPYNRDLSDFIQEADYLPVDFPGNFRRDEYNTFTSYDPARQPIYTSCTKQCSVNYEPVCGNDNQTYYNTCHALCNSTTVSSFGVCNLSGFRFGNCGRCANSSTVPVCGANGRSFPNACFATCAGVTFTAQCCCGSATCCLGEVNDFLNITK